MTKNMNQFIMMQMNWSRFWLVQLKPSKDNSNHISHFSSLISHL